MLDNIVPIVRKALKDRKFVEREAGGDRELLDRLVSRLDMKATWDLVNRSGDDQEFPLEFLMFAGTLRIEWAAKSKVPTEVARRALRDVAANAKKLAVQIQGHEAEVRLLAGVRTDLASLIVQVHEKADREESAAEIARLNWETYRRTGFVHRAIPDFTEVLNHFAEKLDRAAECKPIGGRPRKVNDPNAERTYCVQQLAAFFEKSVGEVPKAEIAESVTVILDLADPLTPSHVAKLLPG